MIRHYGGGWISDGPSAWVSELPIYIKINIWYTPAPQKEPFGRVGVAIETGITIAPEKTDDRKHPLVYVHNKIFNSI